MLKFEEACDITLIDFIRAYNKVSYSVSMVKLSSLRIRGKLLGWLNNFLTNRTHYVTYKVIASEAGAAALKVVKGSFLGPQIFAAMLNNLSRQNCISLHATLH